MTFTCDCKTPAVEEDPFIAYGSVWTCDRCFKAWIMSKWVIPGQPDVLIWVEPQVKNMRVYKS